MIPMFPRHPCRFSFSRWLRAGLLAVGLSSGAAAREPVVIDYWLWDVGQLPAYRDAARVFEEQNPDIRIKLTQIGWLDYWISLTTAFVSDTAPDVFTNHVSRYPEFLRYRTLLDLTPYVVRDRVEAGSYLGELFLRWSRDGRQYALPKDWDTVALIYNREMLREAGVDPAELDNLDWNPHDGGTFGRMIARLTLDRAGENGLSPRFDTAQVVRYGLLMDGEIDGFSQAEWSHFAASNGFTYDDGPWSGRFHYDDPRLAETLQWIRDASGRKRWIVPARDARQIGANGLFVARKGALALMGSWMIGWYARNCPFETGFAPLPVGPQGRKTMLNGLGDSIWSGTRHPEEAWRWVRFLGSREGQMIVARHGVVFPAVSEAAETARDVMNARGADVSVFLRQATAPGGTFSFPLTEQGSELMAIARAAMDEIFLQETAIPPRLETLNRDVNRLFERRR